MNDKYKCPYGMWRVRTEADVEGRSMKELGVYKGYIDDIAFALADRCYYALEFTLFAFDEIPHSDKRADKVNVCLDIESGTWNMTMPERKKFFEDVLAGRNVYVGEGSAYASVMLYRNCDLEKYEKREAALKKLTDEEKQLLGLI